MGGLGVVVRSQQRSGTNGVKIDRARQFDEEGAVDLQAALGIYFVETCARVQDEVVSPSL